MKRYLLFWILSLTILSCTKEQSVPGPTGPQGDNGAPGKSSVTDTASIEGTLFLYDEFSQPVADASGVTITLGNGSKQYNVITDASGQYKLTGIPTGTYDLTYQKTGFGTMKIYSLSHFGGGTTATQVEKVFMEQIPVKTAPNTLTLSSNTLNSVAFNFRLDTSSLQYNEYFSNLLVYVGKHTTVGPSDYSFLLNGVSTPDGGYTASFNKSDLQGIESPVSPGDTLYAVTYKYNRYVRIPSEKVYIIYWDTQQGGSYTDPGTGKIIYPNLSKPSNIVKFAF